MELLNSLRLECAVERRARVAQRLADRGDVGLLRVVQLAREDQLLWIRQLLGSIAQSFARAAAEPALVRSRIRSRSNSAEDPN